MSRPLVALTILASLVAAGAAQAQSPDASGSVRVHYSDLDLGSQAGAEDMLARIRTAAGVACGGEPDAIRLDMHAAFDRCRSQTISQAVDQLHAPLVTAMAGRPAQHVVLASR
jgi:UrcA family protein